MIRKIPTKFQKSKFYAHFAALLFRTERLSALTAPAVSAHRRGGKHLGPCGKSFCISHLCWLPPPYCRGASGFLPVPRSWRGRAAYPIVATVPADTVIYIHLPAVTYEGGLSINGRAINPLGSQEGRTVFTGNTQVTIDGGLICCFDRLDFRGDGSGIGLSASARVHLTNGTSSGWKTGILAYGNTWVNAMDCRFEDNKVGFHFNSTADAVSHTIY